MDLSKFNDVELAFQYADIVKQSKTIYAKKKEFEEEFEKRAEKKIKEAIRTKGVHGVYEQINEEVDRADGE